MTTFTFRASEEITGRLSSAEMRSWLNDFLRQPHPLPPDPGSGFGRVSLTLPANAVTAVATYSQCAISSALRRIAVERLGLRSPVVRQQEGSQSGNEIAGALICFLVWIIFLGVSVVLASRNKKGRLKAARQT
jgi:hypothetical protein